MAVCGSHLVIDFTLPYTDFLPNTIPFNFRIVGETLGRVHIVWLDSWDGIVI
jgi:hypothetical protein